MRNILLALSALAGAAAISTPAAAAIVTFTGVSTGVSDPATGEAEQYRVAFSFDDAVAPLATFHWVTTSGPVTAYDYAYYTNITAISVTGQRFDVAFDTGYAQVSTLDSSRFHDGKAGFTVGAGADGTAIGYGISFNYLPGTAFANTAMPTSLDIAGAFENGFNLTEYYYDGDPADEIITSRELLNFRFASGGIVAASPVPEPATWAMMLAGFGASGVALRRARRRTTIAPA